MVRATLILGFALILVACEPELERPGVPIAMGWQTDRLASAAVRKADYARMKALGVEEVLLEVYVEAGPEGYPIINRTCRSHARKLLPELAKAGFTLSLSLVPDADKPPQTMQTNSLQQREDRDESFFKGFAQEVIDAMPQRCLYPIKRLILASNVIPSKNWFKGKKLNQILKKRLCKNVGLYIGFTSSDIPKTIKANPKLFHQYPIAIFYHQPAEGNWKTQAQQLHSLLGKSLMGQPAKQPPARLFIAQANLIGPSKTVQFKNKLRFWPPEVQLDGVCINNLFNTSVLSDTSAYFGAAHDEELQAYLREYIQTGNTPDE